MLMLLAPFILALMMGVLFLFLIRVRLILLIFLEFWIVLSVIYVLVWFYFFDLLIVSPFNFKGVAFCLPNGISVETRSPSNLISSNVANGSYVPQQQGIYDKFYFNVVSIISGCLNIYLGINPSGSCVNVAPNDSIGQGMCYFLYFLSNILFCFIFFFSWEFLFGFIVWFWLKWFSI